MCPAFESVPCDFRSINGKKKDAVVIGFRQLDGADHLRVLGSSAVVTNRVALGIKWERNKFRSHKFME